MEGFEGVPGNVMEALFSLGHKFLHGLMVYVVLVFFPEFIALCVECIDCALDLVLVDGLDIAVLPVGNVEISAVRDGSVENILVILRLQVGKMLVLGPSFQEIELSGVQVVL